MERPQVFLTFSKLWYSNARKYVFYSFTIHYPKATITGYKNRAEKVDLHSIPEKSCLAKQNKKQIAA